MAEETFDPTTMPETSRYQLKYPAETDLVRFASKQFQTMVESIETALGNVDDRATTEAHSTIVRPTLSQLNQSTAAQGQFGYVYNDTDTNLRGVYIYNGAWVKVTGELPLTVVKQTLAELTETTSGVGTFGLVQADPDSGNDGVYVMDTEGWTPLGGSAGQAIVKTSLAELNQTAATAGTLASVDGDTTKRSNDGLYLMLTNGNWQRVGANTQIITSGFTAKVNNTTTNVESTVWASITDGIAVLHGGIYYPTEITIDNTSSNKIAELSLPAAVRPPANTQLYVPMNSSSSYSSSYSSSSSYSVLLRATLTTTGVLQLPALSHLYMRGDVGEYYEYIRAVKFLTLSFEGLCFRVAE